MTSTELNDFITWYNGNGANGPYVVSKDYNLRPFNSRKDYIPYDKIANFEVMEY